MSPMDATTDQPKINAFNGNNFHLWKFKMQMVLEDRDLWEVVECPDGIKMGDAGEDLMYKKKMKKAMALICLSLADPQLTLVRSCTTAYEVWNTLVKHYEKPSLANRLYLRRKLFTTMMNEGGDMITHINALRTLGEQLGAIGAGVSEDDMVITLLGSLPESYQYLIIALESRADTLSWDFVTSRLLHEESKKKELENNSGVQNATNGNAFYTRGKNGKRAQMSNSRGACHYCGESGHWIKECPKRMKENIEKQKVQSANIANGNKSHEENGKNHYLFMAKKSIAQKSNDQVWYIDSGATQHMTSSKKFMSNYKNISPIDIHLADQRIVSAIGMGDILMKSTVNGKLGLLREVLYVPELEHNLFSVSMFTKSGNEVIFTANTCKMLKSTGEIFKIGEKLWTSLYELLMKPIPNSEKHVNTCLVAREHVSLWHQRLGHINEQRIGELVRNKYIGDLDMKHISNIPFCEACAIGKITRVKFQNESSARIGDILEEVHSDVCGPMRTPTFSGKKYFVTFTDNTSKFCWVYLLQSKSEVFQKFKIFYNFVTNLTGKRIKTLRSDNGGEYVSKRFKEFCENYGILQKFTPRYTPELNGVAERMNRTLVESGRCMLEHANLGNKFWGEAIMTANFLRNRCPTRSLHRGTTPYEIFYGKKPLLQNLKVFGCIAYAHIPSQLRSKWDAKAKKCIFLGYSEHEKAYRLLDISNSEIIISRDVKFNEREFIQNMKNTIGETLCDKFRNFGVGDIIPETRESDARDTNNNCRYQENTFRQNGMPNEENISENDFETQDNAENRFSNNGDDERHVSDTENQVPHMNHKNNFYRNDENFDHTHVPEYEPIQIMIHMMNKIKIMTFRMNKIMNMHVMKKAMQMMWKTIKMKN